MWANNVSPKENELSSSDTWQPWTRRHNTETALRQQPALQHSTWIQISCTIILCNSVTLLLCSLSIWFLFSSCRYTAQDCSVSSCECDISGTPPGNVLNLSTNNELHFKLNWLYFKRSEIEMDLQEIQRYDTIKIFIPRFDNVAIFLIWFVMWYTLHFYSQPNLKSRTLAALTQLTRQ